MYPILAIDYGSKNLGIAISDSKGIVSKPLTTLRISKNTDILMLIDEIKKLIEEYRVETILVGKPAEFEASHSINTRRIDTFINTLKKRVSTPIDTWDESFSTSNAKSIINENGRNFKKGKGDVDSIAASIFLQEYLNSKQ